MTSAEETRIMTALDRHTEEANIRRDLLDKRLGKMADTMSDVKTHIAVVVTRCEACAKFIQGNGQPSAETRLTALETDNKTAAGKGFWAVVGLMSAIVAGLVVAAAQVCGH